MNKKLICIVCPLGCTLDIEYDEESILNIEGNPCPKGEEYAEKEIFHPERTLTTSVRVVNGERPLASVRTTSPIPKAILGKVMTEIRKIKLEAPVGFGQVVIEDVRHTGADVVVTREIKRGGRTGFHLENRG